MGAAPSDLPALLFQPECNSAIRDRNSSASTGKSLNGRWRLLFDPERRYHQAWEIRDWPLAIEVPYPPESHASGIGDRGYHCVCWYERDFVGHARGGRLLLHFGAVDYFAKVWVNGRFVANHEGGPRCSTNRASSG
jgi:beta-galactosidase/beta-glucuronidase